MHLLRSTSRTALGAPPIPHDQRLPKEHATMRRTSLRRLVAPALAASLVLASAGVVAADTQATYVVDPYYCSLTDLDGNPIDPAVITAGSDIIVAQGWFAGTRGQTQSFVNNVTWVLSINGHAVDMASTLTPILNLRPGLWAVFFQVDAGTATGSTFTTHYDNVMRSANFDGSVHWRKGSLYNGGIDCSFPVA
jgi:hypothetical protein